jgi:hypothetical protein
MELFEKEFKIYLLGNQMRGRVSESFYGAITVDTDPLTFVTNFIKKRDKFSKTKEENTM